MSRCNPIAPKHKHNKIHSQTHYMCMHVMCVDSRVRRTIHIKIFVEISQQ